MNEDNNDCETKDDNLHEVHGYLEETKEGEEQVDDRNELKFDYDVETSLEMMLNNDTAEEDELDEAEEIVGSLILPRPASNDFVFLALDTNDNEDGDFDDDDIFAAPLAFTSPIFDSPSDLQISVTSFISASQWSALP